MKQQPKAPAAAPAASDEQRLRFAADGFLVVPGVAGATELERLRQAVAASLAPPLAPLEFEADVHYPGSPADRWAEGGATPRRLLNAYTRHEAFREWATAKRVTGMIRELLGAEHVMLSQNHHNCIMTKHPGFSSETSWHQDIRYWSFDRPELISSWLALGDEHPDNGGLSLLPGTHRLELDRGCFDAALFLRTELPQNRELIATAVAAELKAGDLLLFHCRTFHAAGRNHTEHPKLSLIFTYHDLHNRPIPGTRSARFQDIPTA